MKTDPWVETMEAVAAALKGRVPKELAKALKDRWDAQHRVQRHEASLNASIACVRKRIRRKVTRILGPWVDVYDCNARMLLDHSMQPEGKECWYS